MCRSRVNKSVLCEKITILKEKKMQTGKTNAMNNVTHVNKLRNAKVQNQDYKYQIN